jgi:exoribonuclease R
MLPVRRLRADASEWWELGELGTVMHAQPSGATLRLGQQIEVRVGRIDAPRGRVDLAPAEDEPRQ